MDRERDRERQRQTERQTEWELTLMSMFKCYNSMYVKVD